MSQPPGPGLPPPQDPYAPGPYGQAGQAGQAGVAGTAATAGTAGTSGSSSSGAGVVAGESGVPTVVPAGLAGAEPPSGDLRPLAALLFTGGVLLLIASWVMTRRRGPGAHRA